MTIESINQERIIQSLKKQLLIERAIIAVVLLFLIGRWAYVQISTAPFAVMVNDKPAVFLEDRKSAETVLDQVMRSKAGTVNKVEFTQDVRIRRYRNGGPIAEESEAVNKLNDLIKVKMDKWVITSNGDPVVAVDTEEMATSVLEELKARFGGQIKNLLEEPQFKESVKVEQCRIDEDLYARSVAEAVKKILNPTYVSKPVKKKAAAKSGYQIYTIKDGDIAAVIASRMGISLEKLIELNAGRDLAKLQIGDQIKVPGNGSTLEPMEEAPAVSGKPKITVIARDTKSETQYIPYQTQTTTSMQMRQGKQFEAQPGRNGIREVRMAITYENGVKVGQEIIEENIIREMVPRRIVIGGR